MFEAAIVTALSVIALMWWVGFKWVAKLGVLADIAGFVGLTWMFHGTYIGMMTGATAALLVSVFLRFNRNYWRKHRLAPR